MTENKPTQNSVKFDDNGIIEADYVDKQTYESVAENGDKIYNMAKETRNKGKKVLVLINLTYVKEADSGARKAAFDYIMDLDFDKFAVFGANSYMQIVANLVMHATTKEDKIRLFTTKDEAKEWLQSE